MNQIYEWLHGALKNWHESESILSFAIPPGRCVPKTPGHDTARGKRFHGSIQLEHKDDLKARGEASPDDGDTLAMTFAVKLRAGESPARNLVYSFPGAGDLQWLGS